MNDWTNFAVLLNWDVFGVVIDYDMKGGGI